MGQGYCHLSLDERIVLEKGLDAGLSLRRIAVGLGRAVSTLCRERQRNAWRPGNESAAYMPYHGQGYRRPGTRLQYRAGSAHRSMSKRGGNSHQPRTMTTDRQVSWVCRRVKEDGWSLEQVAGRSRIEFPHDHSMWVSTELLYQWAYHPRNACHRLTEYLPRAHRKRRRKHGRKVHASRIDRRVSISQRPSDVNDRSVFGHWEGDTVEGLRSVGDGIHTEVERVSRFLMAQKIESVTSQATITAQLDLFSALPVRARRSTTLDNGREHHLHWQLTDQLGMTTWFAHPYSSFERGSNERVNGLIRRWLPKHTDLTNITDDDLAWIINKINNAPLKILAWKTPAEVFNQLNSTPHATIALQN